MNVIGLILILGVGAFALTLGVSVWKQLKQRHNDDTGK